jgi:hypothetical protein
MMSTLSKYSNSFLTVLMLVIFSGMLIIASGYPAGARFMPYVLGFPAVALCLLRREAITWGYFLGFIVGIIFFGFHIAVPVFLITFLRFRANAGWLMTLGLTAVACVVLFVAFEQVLHIELHKGFITERILDAISG